MLSEDAEEVLREIAQRLEMDIVPAKPKDAAEKLRDELGKTDVFKVLKISAKHFHPMVTTSMDIGNLHRTIKSVTLKLFHEKNFPVDAGSYLRVGDDELAHLIKLVLEGDRESSGRFVGVLGGARDRLWDKFVSVLDDVKMSVAEWMLEKWVGDLRGRRIVMLAEFSGVSYDEWPNAFIGDADRIVGEGELTMGIMQVLQSVPISNKIAVWFDSSDLLRYFKVMFRGIGDESNQSVRKDIFLDVDFPYLSLVRALLRVYQELDSGGGDEVERFVSCLRSSGGGLVFVSVDRGDRRVYLVPKLDQFAENWLLSHGDVNYVEILLEMFDNVQMYLRGLENAIGSKRKSEFNAAKTQILLKLDNLCYGLLERGKAAPSVVRDLVDVLTFFNVKYNIAFPTFRNLSIILVR